MNDDLNEDHSANLSDAGQQLKKVPGGRDKSEKLKSALRRNLKRRKLQQRSGAEWD